MAVTSITFEGARRVIAAAEQRAADQDQDAAEAGAAAL